MSHGPQKPLKAEIVWEGAEHKCSSILLLWISLPNDKHFHSGFNRFLITPTKILRSSRAFGLTLRRVGKVFADFLTRRLVLVLFTRTGNQVDNVLQNTSLNGSFQASSLFSSFRDGYWQNNTFIHFIADVGIRIEDLWCRKQPLNQLRHNHGPNVSKHLL